MSCPTYTLACCTSAGAATSVANAVDSLRPSQGLGPRRLPPTVAVEQGPNASYPYPYPFMALTISPISSVAALALAFAHAEPPLAKQPPSRGSGSLSLGGRL